MEVPCWLVLVILLIADLTEQFQEEDEVLQIIPSFQCSTGKGSSQLEKIPLFKVCNGKVECSNYADEERQLCKHMRCPPNYFQCLYGACIKRQFVCDGVNDCLDKSDEAYCGHLVGSCDTQDFRCASGQCISARLLCNGKKDCEDGSDETESVCFQYSCPIYSFRCNYGGCIPFDAICNGIIDCMDKSDEMSLLCKGNCSLGRVPWSCTEGCKKGQFRCSDGTCISDKRVCDGFIDCSVDSSDESFTTCSNIICPNYAFRCNYGACIKATFACDGTTNCADGSDENKDLCEIQRPEDSCILPPYPINGRHNIATGAYIKNLGSLTFSCNPGFSLNGTDVVYCYGETWIPGIPSCDPIPGGILCPALKSEYLYIKCFLTSGENYPCHQPAPEGTVATYSCRQYYLPTVNSPNRRSECHNGAWSRELLSCEPVCGKGRGEVTPLVVNGTEAKYGEWPWQAALYVKVGEKTGKKPRWAFQCGGSLISEKLILTGHCVWLVKTESMVVAIGKYYRDYEKRQELTQIKELREILIHPSYLDKKGNYESDLAILVLSSAVTLTSVAQPVCLDWDNKLANLHISHQSHGTVVGWGVTENDTLSEIQRKANLPVISSKQCLEDVPPEFAKYIRSTTFCAGYKNGTSVCNGDSGGGLLFQNKGTWILQGVLSLSPRRKDIHLCDPRYYAIFTRVSSYISWISEIMERTSSYQIMKLVK